MEIININCEHCNQEYEVDIELVGENAKCTACEKEFVVVMQQVKEAPSQRTVPQNTNNIPLVVNPQNETPEESKMSILVTVLYCLGGIVVLFPIIGHFMQYFQRGPIDPFNPKLLVASLFGFIPIVLAYIFSKIEFLRKMSFANFILIVIGLFLLGNCIFTKDEPARPNQTLTNRLSYVSGIEEISKFEIIGNDVYISFANDQLPFDYKIIANAISVNGSELLVAQNETITRCTVWVIPNSLSAGDVSKYFYTVTAKHGKIQ